MHFSSSAFSISLRGKDFFSDVIMTYAGISGRICRDGWDDNDAQVVCRQLNYVGGFAYNHYVEGDSTASGPYWMTDVSCQGHEASLADCQYQDLGDVKECKSSSYAGVLCIDDEGMFCGMK